MINSYDKEKVLSKKKIILTGIVIMAVLILIDRLLKIWAVNVLEPLGSITVIDGVFEFMYLENQGAAFGVLQGARWFFLILTIIITAFSVYVFFKMPPLKKFRFLRITLILLVSGAIGNFIDRLTGEYVVDFLYFKLINFPVFNFADICVTFAEVFLIIAVLFVYKAEDFGLIFKGKAEDEYNS